MKSPPMTHTPSNILSLEPVQQLDTMQQLLQRKAELAKNKAKYTLTETDGTLLVTHATELHFADGQTIVEAGHDISAVYRIKSGKISIIRNGHQCCELTQGYFVGDALLIYDHKSTYRMNVALKANGPVVLLRLDLDFVRRLFSLDISLAMKFYRLFAVKSASILHQLVATIHTTPALLCSSLDSLPDPSSLSSSSSGSKRSLTSSHSLSSMHSLPSNPSTSSLSSSGSFTESDESLCNNIPHPSSTLSKRKSKRLSRTLSTEAYKVYPLLGSKHGVQTCRVKAKKIKIVTKSFGFQHKTSIDFAKLNSLTKISDNAVTIIHQGRKTQTIFFKNYHDREEFLYLVTSLTTPVDQTEPLLTTQPISTPPALDADTDGEDPQVSKGEEHFRTVQVRAELKKGERVFEEGDLYQRVYTLISGSLAVYQKGVFLHYLTEGQVFGVDTILFLRPCPVTIEVASETATVLIIPAYKMMELLDSDVAVAVQLFKRSAQILDAQITKILQIEQKSLQRMSQEIPVQPRTTQETPAQSRISQEIPAQHRISQEFDKRSSQELFIPTAQGVMTQVGASD